MQISPGVKRLFPNLLVGLRNTNGVLEVRQADGSWLPYPIPATIPPQTNSNLSLDASASPQLSTLAFVHFP